jgi:hypothetical protein
VCDCHDIEELAKMVDVDMELGYVFEAIMSTRTALDGEVQHSVDALIVHDQRQGQQDAAKG